MKRVYLDFLDTMKVKKEAVKRGLSAEQLAEACGIGDYTAKTFYSLPYRPYRVKTVKRLADYFKCEPAELITSRADVLREYDDLERRAATAEKEGRAGTAAQIRGTLELIKSVL